MQITDNQSLNLLEKLIYPNLSLNIVNFEVNLSWSESEIGF